MVVLSLGAVVDLAWGGGDGRTVVGKTPRLKPVAVCVSGLTRAFYATRRIHVNAWSHMVWPIVSEADVFFVLDATTPGRSGVRGRIDAATASDLAAEAKKLWRPVYDARLESTGLDESLALFLPGSTFGGVRPSGVLDWSSGAEHEAAERSCRASAEASTSRETRRREARVSLSRAPRPTSGGAAARVV